MKKALPSWFSLKERILLLKWSAGFFVFAAILFILVGLRYFTAYSLPHEPLAIAYTFAAFTSHFASFALIFWAVIVLPLICIVPFRKIIIPVSVLIVATAASIILLDSQIFTSHRFHFTILTIRILGWKTWGFGLVYMFIFLVLSSFLADIAWKRYTAQTKKHTWAVHSLIATVILLLFTHGTHVWADATGYLPVTRFTTTLPLFYPSTDKKFMTKHGFADIANRRELPQNLSVHGSTFFYPRTQLQFDSSIEQKNILIIAIDDLRSDMITPELTPSILSRSNGGAIRFTNHWSGGNSTKMGLFSLFYGISPTYQQYIESNKISPVIIDRMLDKNYETGIYTSYKLYAPACLDVSAFVKIKNLRLETKIPGSQDVYRKDSAITAEWMQWLDKRSTDRNFFGFLFYDLLSVEGFPPSYESRLKIKNSMTEHERKFEHYKTGVQFLDSLVGVVLDDLTKRDLYKNTVIIITADHGEEYNENGLGFTGHGSAFSKYQLRVPLIVFWPGKEPQVISKRTSHNDIAATLIKDAFGCKNPENDYSSGISLFSDNQWEWLITGSYFNFAINEPEKTTVQYPGGYYEMRDSNYKLVSSKSLSPNLSSALEEMGRFYRK